MGRAAIPPPPTTRVLLVTAMLEEGVAGGREMLSRLNLGILRHVYGNGLLVMSLGKKRTSGMRLAMAAFRGYIDGLSKEVIRQAVETAREERVDKVFVDGSNLGSLVMALKVNLPQVEVTTFFHNVEARFFWGSLRLRRTLHAVGVLAANYFAERRAVRYSDKRVCLSARDSELLRRLYGRSATHISAMALLDRRKAVELAAEPGPHEPFALFVGGTFYANHAGIRWYVRNVAPHTDVRVLVVGKGFEAYRSELDVPGKVHVIGTVESLGDWYNLAQFVIAPIFDGSGMKTKVAEALMYGKKVVGTPEAFSGYEEIAGRAGWVCRTADEFIRAMSEASDSIRTRFHPEMRDLYTGLYSVSAAEARLRKILES